MPFHKNYHTRIIIINKNILFCDYDEDENDYDVVISNIVNINQIKFLSIYQISDSLQGYHEKRLLNTLLNNYNLLERPVANESEPLEVRFGLTLQQIIDVVS